ncbi:ribonuclease III [Sphingoaurantiacus capsulatus]|uniref:Ribonuclease 3 n=1 Tax=Sphingoaurantiacus capsulatus TaxID=1771310 RepID=A0ABV7X7G3_9SPHN
MTAAADWAAGALGHAFRDPRLLDRALTHASAGKPDYERLEFLGDRVLGFVIAAWLYADLTDEAEGKLSRRFAELVSRETCAAVAREIGVVPHIILGAQARGDRAHQSENVLGDIVEAMIGALHIDGGIGVAESFVRRAWAPHMALDSRAPKHPKSALQEWANGRGLRSPEYAIVDRSGPQHAPVFRVQVTVRGHDPVTADGTNKQEAETAAAQAMLDRLTA